MKQNVGIVPEKDRQRWDSSTGVATSAARDYPNAPSAEIASHARQNLNILSSYFILNRQMSVCTAAPICLSR
jgi:hypothetical protein